MKARTLTTAALALTLALGAFASTSAAVFNAPLTSGEIQAMSHAERAAELRALGYPGAHLMRDALQIKILLKAEQEKAQQASVANQDPRAVPTKKGSQLTEATVD